MWSLHQFLYKYLEISWTHRLDPPYWKIFKIRNIDLQFRGPGEVLTKKKTKRNCKTLPFTSNHTNCTWQNSVVNEWMKLTQISQIILCPGIQTQLEKWREEVEKKIINNKRGREFIWYLKVINLYHGGLNKKEIQLNLCNMFSILIFNEFILFA